MTWLESHRKHVDDGGMWTMNWPPVSVVKMGLVGMHWAAVWQQEAKTASRRVWRECYISA